MTKNCSQELKKTLMMFVVKQGRAKLLTTEKHKKAFNISVFLLLQF